MSRLDKLISEVLPWQQVVAALAVVILMLGYGVYVILSSFALIALLPLVAARDGFRMLRDKHRASK